MRLFSVPPGRRVRITSKLIRWIEHQSEQTVAEGITWEGTTTNRYCFYKGAERRLIIRHTIPWPAGIWQKDTNCEIIESAD